MPDRTRDASEFVLIIVEEEDEAIDHAGTHGFPDCP